MRWSAMQTSTQLVEVLLTDLPEMSALMDPNTGAELQRYIAIRDAWQAFVDDTTLLLVRTPVPPGTRTVTDARSGRVQPVLDGA